jgi:hypothetical protein
MQSEQTLTVVVVSSEYPVRVRFPVRFLVRFPVRFPVKEQEVRTNNRPCSSCMQSEQTLTVVSSEGSVSSEVSSAVSSEGTSESEQQAVLLLKLCYPGTLACCLFVSVRSAAHVGQCSCVLSYIDPRKHHACHLFRELSLSF